MTEQDLTQQKDIWRLDVGSLFSLCLSICLLSYPSLSEMRIKGFILPQIGISRQNLKC